MLRLEGSAEQLQYDRHRESGGLDAAGGSGASVPLDVHAADDRLQDRYGRNSFGWSLLMARQLAEAGAGLACR
ncbi:MAG UNVERIFIED_CONTAM: hypothetical protein LVR18_36420 [Planctomycetaceae bacterium]